MKNILIIMCSLLLLTACSNSRQNKVTGSGTSAETVVTDTHTVYVYYFYGKQRCTTCNTVEEIAKKTVEANFSSNSKVKFVLIATDEVANKALVEKYEISWNGLVIAKGEDSINITEEAFTSATNSPEALVNLLKTEVNNRLN